MKKQLKTILATSILSLFTLLPIAHAIETDTPQPTEGFTIHPTYTHQNNSHWIIHSPEPGDNIRDYLTIQNYYNYPITLDLKFQEAQSTENEFTPINSTEFQNLGNWLKFQPQKITLPAQSTERIPFTFQIPEITNPQEYTGVFFAEYTPTTQENSLPITTRIGVRTYLKVQAPTILPITKTLPNHKLVLLILALTTILATTINIFKKSQSLAKSPLIAKTLTILIIPIILTILSPLVQAQVLELEITQGGYRLNGPAVLNFPQIESSFEEQTSQINFSDIPSVPFLEIEDQNGSTPFSVNVSATNFISEKNVIPNNNLFIKNNDGTTPEIKVIKGDTATIELNTSTNKFASLSETQTILDKISSGSPGKWQIFPSLRLIIPANTKSGIYTTNITFTII